LEKETVELSWVLILFLRAGRRRRPQWRFSQVPLASQARCATEVLPRPYAIYSQTALTITYVRRRPNNLLFTGRAIYRYRIIEILVTTIYFFWDYNNHIHECMTSRHAWSHDLPCGYGNEQAFAPEQPAHIAS